MRRLLFTQGHPPYNSGEEATFEDEHAGALVSRGVADYVDPLPLVEGEDDEPVDQDDDPAATKAPARPPADKMVRPAQTLRKKG